MIKIRNAKQADLEDIVNLHSKTLDTLSSRMGLKYLGLLYMEILANPDIHFLFIAESNKNIIGVISATSDLNKTKNLLFSPKIIIEASKALLLLKVSFKYLFRRLKEEKIILKEIEKDSIYIMTLFVSKNFRGKGIGKSLVRKVLNNSNKRKIFVNTLTLNKKAQKFYESFGFKKIKTILSSKLYVYTK